jgi:hypothetical protein
MFPQKRGTCEEKMRNHPVLKSALVLPLAELETNIAPLIDGLD